MIRYRITRDIARKLSRQLTGILLFILVGIAYQYSVRTLTPLLPIFFVITLLSILFLNNRITHHKIFEKGTMTKRTARINIAILFGLGITSFLFGVVATTFSIIPPSDVFVWISIGLTGISAGLTLTSSFVKK